MFQSHENDADRPDIQPTLKCTYLILRQDYFKLRNLIGVKDFTPEIQTMRAITDATQPALGGLSPSLDSRLSTHKWTARLNIGSFSESERKRWIHLVKI